MDEKMSFAVGWLCGGVAVIIALLLMGVIP